MLHNICGRANHNAVCMVVGFSAKKFPRAFRPIAEAPEYCFYPLYRRTNPKDGAETHTRQVRWRNDSYDEVIDIYWVFPYTKNLLLMF